MNLWDFLTAPTLKYDPAKLYDPNFGKMLAKKLMPYFEAYFRVEYKGLEHLPTKPFIGISNHSAGTMVLDSIIWVGKYISLNRTPYMVSMVHSLLGSVSLIDSKHILRKLGIHTASNVLAKRALDEGFALYLCPGGEQDNYRSFANRNKIDFYGHKGYVKLALQTMTPICPIVSIGAHETMMVIWDGKPLAHFLHLDKLLQLHVFPLTLSLGAGLNFGRQVPFIPLPAQITYSVLPPFDISSFSPEDANNQQLIDSIDLEIRTRMQTEMDRLAKDRIPVIGKISK